MSGSRSVRATVGSEWQDYGEGTDQFSISGGAAVELPKAMGAELGLAKVSWTFTPIEQWFYEVLDDPCPLPGSVIGAENQSLSQGLPVFGTQFTLHYQSDRAPGFIGTSYDRREQALGGWTLDVHHAYSPEGKTLYFGDGRRRRGDALGAGLHSRSTGRTGLHR